VNRFTATRRIRPDPSDLTAADRPGGEAMERLEGVLEYLCIGSTVSWAIGMAYAVLMFP
jgi:hypothetical protein